VMKSKNIQMQGMTVFNRLNSTEVDTDNDNDNDEIEDFSFNNSKLLIHDHKRLGGLSAGGAAIGFILTVLFTTLIGMSIASYIADEKNHSSAGAETCPELEDGLNPLSFQHYEVSAWNGTVATDVYECSRVGAEVLYEGGNAIDAAIAAAFCLGVLSPASSGIGGGCMMVHYDAAADSAVFMDSREVAPAGASPDMFVDTENTGLQPSLNGGLAVGVLAEVKGLYLAHEQRGSGRIPWSRLVAPAAELAKSWVINDNVATSIRGVQEHLFSGEYPELSALYLKKNGTAVKEKGDSVQQPLLSQTLALIGQYGADYIYKNMSAAIARDIQEAGGIVTQEDIEGYEPRLHEPVSADLLGFRYYGASGASSGGATVAGILSFMGNHLQPLAGLPRADYDHLYAEASSHAFAVSHLLCHCLYLQFVTMIKSSTYDSLLVGFVDSGPPGRPRFCPHCGGRDAVPGK
jgi:gamma-glutamyltranspeptidase